MTLTRSEKIALAGVIIAFLSLLKQRGTLELPGIGDVGAAGGGGGGGLDDTGLPGYGAFTPGTGEYFQAAEEPLPLPETQPLQPILPTLKPSQPPIPVTEPSYESSSPYTPPTITPTTTGRLDIPTSEIATTAAILGAGPAYRKIKSIVRPRPKAVQKKLPTQPRPRTVTTVRTTAKKGLLSRLKFVLRRPKTPGISILPFMGLSAVLAGTGIERVDALEEGEKPASFWDILEKTPLSKFLKHDTSTTLSQAAATSSAVQATIQRQTKERIARQQAEAARLAAEKARTTKVQAARKTTAKKGSSTKIYGKSVSGGFIKVSPPGGGKSYYVSGKGSGPRYDYYRGKVIRVR